MCGAAVAVECIEDVFSMDVKSSALTAAGRERRGLSSSLAVSFGRDTAAFSLSV